ncbi:hypothetical protein K2X89_07030, partial [Myxococcota bacterium]|nr:hypothetical protein [Myxococcota bacterium]
MRSLLPWLLLLVTADTHAAPGPEVTTSDAATPSASQRALPADEPLAENLLRDPVALLRAARTATEQA